MYLTLATYFAVLCTFTCLALSDVSVNDNWMSVALTSKEILDDISESEK